MTDFETRTDLPQLSALCAEDDGPAAGVDYPQALRTGRNRWWKGVLAILSLVAAYLVLGFLLGVLAIGVDVATGRTSMEAISSGRIPVTPMIFLANNLSLAALLPLAMVLQWGFFGVRPRWLSSVRGGFRWAWFGRAAMIIMPLWVAYIAVTFIVYPQSLTWGRLGADALTMTVIVVLTTPLQSAGEEYGARGLINRAAASWSADPRVALALGALVSGVSFMIAHGAGDLWLNAYYLVFGISLAVIAWRTGGLEVPVLIHATNNLLVVIPTALFGDLTSLFDRQAGAGGPFVLVPITMMIISVGVVEWWARRSGVQRRTASMITAGTTSRTSRA